MLTPWMLTPLDAGCARPDAYTLGIRTATACTQLTPTHALRIRTPLTSNCMERVALGCLPIYHIYYTSIDSNSSKHRVAAIEI
jgi:hypothetical protein